MSAYPSVTARHALILRKKLDSIKSRLQTTKQRVSIPRLALTVYQEEGIVGFYRGLWIPLMTISFVRAYSPTLSSALPQTRSPATLGAASFTIYSRTKEYCRDHDWFAHDRIFDVSAAGGIRFASAPSAPPLPVLTRTVP